MFSNSHWKLLEHGTDYKAQRAWQIVIVQLNISHLDIYISYYIYIYIFFSCCNSSRVGFLSKGSICIFIVILKAHRKKKCSQDDCHQQYFEIKYQVGCDVIENRKEATKMESKKVKQNPWKKKKETRTNQVRSVQPSKQNLLLLLSFSKRIFFFIREKKTWEITKKRGSEHFLLSCLFKIFFLFFEFI